MADAETEVGWLPLTMGEALVGKVRFDMETGEFNGRLKDPELVALLQEFFGNNLMEMSFYGKPVIQGDRQDTLVALQQKLQTWLRETAEKQAAEDDGGCGCDCDSCYYCRKATGRL